MEGLLAAAATPANANPQDRLIDLLAGAAPPEASDAHDQLVQDMIRVFESQRLASLSTLFDLADNLDSVGRGEKLDGNLPAEMRVFSHIDHAHSSLTDFLQDPIM